MNEDPLTTVQAWFDAFAESDLDRARSLLSPNAQIHPGKPTPTLNGFDELVGWYEGRRATQGSFSYELDDLLQTETHAVAFLTLRTEDDGAPRAWQQVAIYRVIAAQIEEVWLFEDP